VSESTRKPEQLAAIRRLLGSIKEKSAFYRRKFADIDLAGIESWEDFERLPFSEKADLRDAYPLGLQAVPDEEVIRIHS
jgi:phenylacetate-CoA ligase